MRQISAWAGFDSQRNHHKYTDPRHCCCCDSKLCNPKATCKLTWCETHEEGRAKLLGRKPKHPVSVMVPVVSAIEQISIAYEPPPKQGPSPGPTAKNVQKAVNVVGSYLPDGRQVIQWNDLNHNGKVGPGECVYNTPARAQQAAALLQQQIAYQQQLRQQIEDQQKLQMQQLEMIKAAQYGSITSSVMPSGWSTRRWKV